MTNESLIPTVVTGAQVGTGVLTWPTPVARTGSAPQVQLSLPDLDAFTVTDMDGWSGQDLMDWLIPWAAALQTAEQRTDAIRRAVGVGLWKLREELGDGAYGRQVADLATKAGVSARTMRRWRESAEEHYGLPVPDASKKRREGQQRRKDAAPAIEVEATEVSAPVVEEGEEPSANSGADPGQRAPASSSSTDVQPPAHPFQTEAPDPEPAAKPKKPKSRAALSLVNGSGPERADVADPESDEERIKRLLHLVSLPVLLGEVKKRAAIEWADVPFTVAIEVKAAAARRELEVRSQSQQGGSRVDVKPMFKGKS